jgi:hypothetical protein
MRFLRLLFIGEGGEGVEDDGEDAIANFYS